MSADVFSFEEIRNRNIQKNAEYLLNLFGLPNLNLDIVPTEPLSHSNSKQKLIFCFFKIQFGCDIFKCVAKHVYSRNEIVLEIINYLDSVIYISKSVRYVYYDNSIEHFALISFDGMWKFWVWEDFPVQKYLVAM